MFSKKRFQFFLQPKIDKLLISGNETVFFFWISTDTIHVLWTDADVALLKINWIWIVWHFYFCGLEQFDVDDSEPRPPGKPENTDDKAQIIINCVL